MSTASDDWLAARGGRGLLVHVDLLGSVHDLDAVADVRPFECGPDLRLVADQRDTEAAGPLAQRERHTLRDRLRPEVASHRVQPDARDGSHRHCVARLRLARRRDLLTGVVAAIAADAVRQRGGRNGCTG